MSTNSLDFFDTLNRFSQVLNNKDPLEALQIFNDCTGDQKASLMKIYNEYNENLLHCLATKIFNDQDEGLDSKDLIYKTIEILKTNELKEYLKDVLTFEDILGYNFLELAVFWRNERLDFVYQILKIVPKPDRAACQIVIKDDSFQETLNNPDNENKKSILGALLGMFYLSQKSERTSLAKKCNPNGETIFHILASQMIEDKSINRDILIKALKKIDPKDRKEIALLQNSKGQNLFHLADLCNENLGYLLLNLIPQDDKAEILESLRKGERTSSTPAAAAAPLTRPLRPRRTLSLRDVRAMSARRRGGGGK